MRKTPLLFLANILPVSIATLAGCNNQKGFTMNPNPVGQKISYRVKSMGGDEVNEYCYYTDDYFRKPASEYNISLATTSMSMVQAAFPAYKGGLTDYSQKYINFVPFAEAMGYSNVYWNEDYVTKPDKNTIGLIMASKKIDDYTIIMLGIRGSEYGSEWAGNFYMGASGHHAGFKLAADKTIDTLNYYIDENNIQGKIKIWMGGFSRSAAVCNLAAGRLDEALIFGEKVLSENVSYTKDDLYAFCFEPPQGASVYSLYDIQSTRFNNIYCFTNFHDLVPRVAPTNFGFTRYGRQLYFPCSLFNPNDYPAYEKAMEFLYNRTESARSFGPYMVNSFDTLTFDFSSKKEPIHVDDNKINWQQGLFMDDFIEALSTIGIPNRKIFNDQYQDGLMELFRITNNTNSEESRIFTKSFMNIVLDMTNYNLSSVIIDDFFNDQSMLPQDLIPFFLRAYEKYGITTTAEELGAVLGNFISALAKVTLNNKENIASIFNVYNVSRILNAHSFEIALAWLRSMDPNYLLEPIDYHYSNSFYKITLGGKLDCKVYDDNDKLIMQFKSGVPVLAGRTQYTYGIQENIMSLYLPENQYYRIVLSDSVEGNYAYRRYLFNFSDNGFVLKKSSTIHIVPGEELTINIVPSNAIKV